MHKKTGRRRTKSFIFFCETRIFLEAGVAFVHFLHVWALFWNPHSFLFLKTKSLKSFSFIFLLSYLSFLAFDVVSRSRGKPLFSFSFSFFPQFSQFFSFFAKKNKRRERKCKKRVFSRFEFLRTFYEVYGCIRAVFSTSLARAVPSQRARVEGTGRG